ncbi:hypothetical protein HN018_28335 (plasmid) [Lichenicola cladoniae]|uniref:Uncharacterized protein n=1 Tax=Lichenicola cladoniae TaxID=1484109 RepID=A0A6M8I1V9_9PROT|nr:hypothetical protein [Lichenicola cladoniae]NPD69771.1 hypothetical protein [Acetobacteraceae bacterium]QKE94015.1 hypothetical protein HN018_28335 [Lichenicola cladoniae]
MWAIEDISFEMVNDMTDDPVMTLVVKTPVGALVFTAEPVAQGSILILQGTHVQGAHKGAVGGQNLGVIAQAVMKGMGFDGLVVEGAVRTTGARPGRRPRDIRYTRRVLDPPPVGSSRP